MAHIQVYSGHPRPLGATWNGRGVNFAICSRHATRVELCLFASAEAQKESLTIPLPARTDDIWHVYVVGIRPGQLYGYRVHGPYRPDEGHRFNANKVLLDPYARAIGRELRWSDASFGYEISQAADDRSFDHRDNAAFAPLAAVIDQRFAWGNDQAPRTSWERTVIYEAHVRGTTRLNPDVSESIRGTYAGLASGPMIRHLRKIGATAIELLPVQYHLDERQLVERGLVNYWGYSPLAYFSPHPRYSGSATPQEQVNEFKRMVKRLHAAGIEVLIDVVYNHTGEGNHLGPTVCFRGIDNQLYYRLSKMHRRYYDDYSGCGNCLEMRHPAVLKLIADSLRYWVEEMHVDGFRFDLAPVLGRDLGAFNRLAAFFQIAQQDPVLSQVKLIAEPWDLGEHGYQLGSFPSPWREWNGKYRDTVRDFWRGEANAKGAFASRLVGSQDVFPVRNRSATASVNYITCHDGFSLHDLVSYNHKRNAANGESDRDGDDHNHSWNCGVEGPTDDPAILALRQQQTRNFLVTLFLSQGVPMLRAGDELAHTQRGNNNAYCQDNELSWLSWTRTPDQRELIGFVRRLARLRQSLLKKHLLVSHVWDLTTPTKEVHWVRQDGELMTEQDWHTELPQLGILMTARTPSPTIENDTHVTRLYVVFNSHREPLVVRMPQDDRRDRWRLVLDTAQPNAKRRRCTSGEYVAQAHSTVVFEQI